MIPIPLLSSHLHFAHDQWKAAVSEGDHVIDATCGKGRDTLKLAQLVGDRGSVIGMDIQEEALQTTQHLLLTHLTLQQLSSIYLFHQSHTQFPLLVYQLPIKLIVYNLGYLPGNEKGLTTMATSTLQSVKEAMHLLQFGGLISITCYPGHPEGKKEQDLLLLLAEDLPSLSWQVNFHQNSSSQNAPSVLLIKKIAN